MPDDSSAFASLFKPKADYLPLLNLVVKEAPGIVQRVVSLTRSLEKPYDEIGSLLDTLGWRPHLVAAVALAVTDYDFQVYTKLWNAIDSGCWVTPQLAAVAFLRDPEFSEQSRKRIRALCPIQIRNYRFLANGEIEESFPSEATTRIEHSGKMAAALTKLLSLLPNERDWLILELANSELKQLLEKDSRYDMSGGIAEDWLVRLQTMI